MRPCSPQETYRRSREVSLTWGGYSNTEDTLPSETSATRELVIALSAFSWYAPTANVGATFTFLQRHVVGLFFHSSVTVRLEAALLTLRLLAPKNEPVVTTGRPGLAASSLLQQLACVAVGDTDENLRIRVLTGFDWRFLPALAEPVLLRALALALHDASLTVRLVSVQLIGSLAGHNPAVAKPLLRKALLTVLSQLRSSTEMMHRAITRRSHEEAATLLAAIERNAPHLARTYCLQILQALLPLLQPDAPPLTASAVTYTVAELLPIAGPLLNPYASELLELFLMAMRPAATPMRRRAALTALERLVSCRGPDVLHPSPYERSATLLPTMISLLAIMGDEVVRGTVLRIIGLLGALDPPHYRAAVAKAEHAEKEVTLREGNRTGTDENTAAALAEPIPATQSAATQPPGGSSAITAALSGQWGDELSPSSPQYLPTIALRELMAILHDASLSAYHHRLIAAIVYIFTALGDTCAPLLPRVMPTLLTILLQDALRGAGSGANGSTPIATVNTPAQAAATGGPLKAVGVASLSRPATTQVFNHLMQQLPVLVSAMHAHMQPWVPQLVELVRMHWHGPLLLQVIMLLEQLTLLLRQELTPYAAELIPQLSAVVDADSTSQRVPSLAALAALDGFGPLLRDYSALLLPTILRLVDQVESGSRAQDEALSLLQRLSAHLPLARAATTYVPVLLRIFRNETGLRTRVVKLLTTLMAMAGRAWRVHNLMVCAAFEEANLPQSSVLQSVLAFPDNAREAVDGHARSVRKHKHANNCNEPGGISDHLAESDLPLHQAVREYASS